MADKWFFCENVQTGPADHPSGKRLRKGLLIYHAASAGVNEERGRLHHAIDGR